MAFDEGPTAEETTRAEQRERLAADVAAFLKSGGKVEEVPRGYRADPPRKPETNYGRGSL